MEHSMIRIAGFETESIVDGPGIRFVLFVQGCFHHCNGCHNPETHDPNGGILVSSERVLEMLDDCESRRDVTFSGGEPFEQAKALVPVAREIKERGLHLTIFTGYLFEDLLKKTAAQPEIFELLSFADILVDGPFVLSKRSLELKFRGSSNQRVIDVQKSLLQEAGAPPILWKSSFEKIEKKF